jgi:hypothetical protein
MFEKWLERVHLHVKDVSFRDELQVPFSPSPGREQTLFPFYLRPLSFPFIQLLDF